MIDSWRACGARARDLLRRLRPAFARLAATCLAIAWFSGLAAGGPSPEVGRRAGETATTHRPGDLIVYRFACHDPEAMIALAERGGAGDLAVALVLQGACFQNSSCIAATLEGWIAGPYAPPRGTPGSVWRVRDQLGDTEFVWINDSGGPHQPTTPTPPGLRQGGPPEPRWSWGRRREMAL